MRVKAFAFVIALAFAVSAFAQAADYIVGPQDVLTIQVFDQPDMVGKYPVELDGSISYPLIGRIKVGGLTLREVEEQLKKALANGFFRNPHVGVAVDQYRSQEVIVGGEVRNPASYNLNGEMTLSTALARAGWLTSTAGDEALIYRSKSGSGVVATAPNGQVTGVDVEVIHVDIRDPQNAGTYKLRDGDTVFVPKAATMIVTGQVKSPGEYVVRSDTTVQKALALAGGRTDRGSDRGIKIVRTVGGERRELPARLDTLLQAGDTVVVPERFF